MHVECDSDDKVVRSESGTSGHPVSPRRAVEQTRDGKDSQTVSRVIRDVPQTSDSLAVSFVRSILTIKRYLTKTPAQRRFGHG